MFTVNFHFRPGSEATQYVLFTLAETTMYKPTSWSTKFFLANRFPG